MEFRIYTRMEFCKVIKAKSREEAEELAKKIEYDWDDCFYKELALVAEV